MFLPPLPLDPYDGSQQKCSERFPSKKQTHFCVLSFLEVEFQSGLPDPLVCCLLDMAEIDVIDIPVD